MFDMFIIPFILFLSMLFIILLFSLSITSDGESPTMYKLIPILIFIPISFFIIYIATNAMGNITGNTQQVTLIDTKYGTVELTDVKDTSYSTTSMILVGKVMVPVIYHHPQTTIFGIYNNNTIQTNLSCYPTKYIIGDSLPVKLDIYSNGNIDYKIIGYCQG